MTYFAFSFKLSIWRNLNAWRNIFGDDAATFSALLHWRRTTFAFSYHWSGLYLIQKFLVAKKSVETYVRFHCGLPPLLRRGLRFFAGKSVMRRMGTPCNGCVHMSCTPNVRWISRSRSCRKCLCLRSPGVPVDDPLPVCCVHAGTQHRRVESEIWENFSLSLVYSDRERPAFCVIDAAP